VRDGLWIQTGAAEARAALVRAGRPIEMRFSPHPDDPTTPNAYGDVLLGRLAAAAPHLSGAFVDLGPLGGGFLPAKGFPDRDGMSEGSKLIVQIAAEARGGKGPQLTARPRLLGRGLAMAPRETGAQASRRIPRDGRGQALAAAERLAAAMGAGRWIVRRAGVSEMQLTEEARELVAAWRAIQTRAETAKPGDRLAERAPPAVEAARDLYPGAPAVIDLDDAAAFTTARAYGARRLPEAVPLIALRLPGESGAFSAEALDAEIDAALSRVVALPGGARLIVDEAEALTAIDVDASQAADRLDPLAVNVRAAAEIGRQLRLRDIGGQTVVDFIRMRGDKAQARVRAALEAAVAEDPAPVRLGGFTRLGLFELTRARTRASLRERLTEPFESEGWAGRRLRTEALAKRALAALEAALAGEPSRRLRLDAAPRAALYLAERSGWADRVAARFGRRFDIAERGDLGAEGYRVHIL